MEGRILSRLMGGVEAAWSANRQQIFAVVYHSHAGGLWAWRASK
jgi:hypothetical protein